MVMVDLCIAILGSLVLARLVTRRRIIMAAALVIAVVELSAAPLPLAEVADAGVYAHVKADPGSGAVLPIPFGVRDGFGEQGILEPDALYAQTVHHHPLVGGFLARLPPRIWSWYATTEPYSSLLALSSGQSPALPSCDAVINGLTAASVSYVVLYRGHTSSALTAFVGTRMPLRQVAEDATRTLFAVTADGCRE
jgi:hypothetical protein